jgi:hypothetical protein
MGRVSEQTSGAPLLMTDEFLAARSGANVKLTGADLRYGLTQSVTVDIRDLASGFNFNGTTDDRTAWAAAMTAAPASARILIPGLESYISNYIEIPKKNLEFIAAPGFRARRKDAVVLFTTISCLDTAAKQAIADTMVLTSGAAYPLSTGNSVQTYIPVADASLYAQGDIIKIVAEEETPGCVPFDVSHTKKNRLGQFLVVTKVDTTTTPERIYVAGEVFDRALYLTGRYVIKISEETLTWRGGSFVSEGSWVGTAVHNYFEMKGRVRPKFEQMVFENGSGTAINIVGCVEAIASDIDVTDMGNTSAVPGYGVICCSSQSTTMRNIRSKGDMRHGMDANIAQTSDDTFNYDYYGASRNPYFELPSDFGSGHSPLSPHLPTVGVRLNGLRSVAGVSGRNAQGAGVSARGTRGLYTNISIENRPVGIEVNDQVSGQCKDNTFQSGVVYGTSAGCFVSSLISSTVENGTAVTNTRVLDFDFIYSRGVAASLCTGTGYRFERVRTKLFGANTLTTPAMIVTGGNNVESVWVNCDFDAADYTGASGIYAIQESAGRTGIRHKFIRCRFLGVAADWAGILDCGTPTATVPANGLSALNIYEFEDCEFPAGVTMVANQGTAIVRVKSSRQPTTNGPMPAVGELLMPINNPQGTDSNPTYASILGVNITAYSLFEIPEIGTWDAGILLMTAQSAAEFRMAVYSAKRDDRIHQLLQDLGAYDASALPGGAAGFAAPAGTWTNPFPGRFWVQWQLKARAATQIQFKRVNAVDSYMYPMTVAQWVSASYGPARAMTSTETYGAAAAVPTSVTSFADSQMIPVIMLRRTA